MEWQKALALLKATGSPVYKIGSSLKVKNPGGGQETFPIGGDGKVLPGPVMAYVKTFIPPPSATPPTISSISSLEKGDTLRNKGSGVSYIVVWTSEDRAVAVRTVEITNPSEWEKVGP